MRLLPVSAAASSAAVLLAGCGSHTAATPPALPRLPHALAARLAAEADAVARATTGANRCHGHTPALRLKADALAAQHRVPVALRRNLLAAVYRLAASLPACPAPPPPPTTAPPATTPHHVAAPRPKHAHHAPAHHKQKSGHHKQKHKHHKKHGKGH